MGYFFQNFFGLTIFFNFKGLSEHFGTLFGFNILFKKFLFLTMFLKFFLPHYFTSLSFIPFSFRLQTYFPIFYYLVILYFPLVYKTTLFSLLAKSYLFKNFWGHYLLLRSLSLLGGFYSLLFTFIFLKASGRDLFFCSFGFGFGSGVENIGGILKIFLFFMETLEGGVNKFF